MSSPSRPLKSEPSDPKTETAEILGRLERFGIKLGLDTTRRLLSQLGSPQRKYPTVLVAGTNGKGSTAAVLAAMGRAAGYRVGLFTSPHLESVRERLRIDGRGIDDTELADRLNRVVATGEKWLGHPPSYFEALCVAALDWYAEREIDFAVLEVGLGGRLDSTNACEPILSLITTLAFDHEELLGYAIEEIAREKAGILRSGRPALTAATGRGLAELERHAAKLGARLEQLEERASLRTRDSGLARQTFEVETRHALYRLDLALGGAHQRQNAALAAVAAEELKAAGFDRLDRQAVERGAAHSRWPGRLEAVELPGGQTVVLDAAHNPAGAKVLARHLARHFPHPTLVFGVLKKKNAAAMLEQLTPEAERVLLTRPPTSRAQEPDELPLSAVGGRAVEVVADLEQALDRALSDSPRIVVCGSLYLIGAIRTLLRRRFGIPPPALDLA